MGKRYVIDLSDEERIQLAELTSKGKVSARKLKRAQILLAANEGVPDATIAKAVHVDVATVERTRKRFVEGGLEWALNERPRPGGRPKLDGRQEAYLIALACSTPPAGRQRWTMQLLADRLVKIEVVESISDETVRRVLKKGTSNLG